MVSPAQRLGRVSGRVMLPNETQLGLLRVETKVEGTLWITLFDIAAEQRGCGTETQLYSTHKNGMEAESE
jgi:hypothetical protein